MKVNSLIIAALVHLWVFNAVHAAQPVEADFREPPEWTRPCCYWYWMNDNVSTEGITRDLEAMAAVGIGEAFVGNIYLDEEPPGDVPVLSELWWQMIEHAIREGGRVGVDVGLFNCPGWSQSGGPWIGPERAMRYVNTAELRVDGPTHFRGKLPELDQPAQDIAVLAFAVPEEDGNTAADHLVELTCTPNLADAERLFDGKKDAACRFPEPSGKAKTIVMDIRLDGPFTARSLTLWPGRIDFIVQCVLEARGEDGQFHEIRNFICDRSNPSISVGPMVYGPVAVAFDAVQSEHFRLTLTQIHKRTALVEIELSAAPRLESYIEKQLGKVSQSPVLKWDTYMWPPSTEPKEADLAVEPMGVLDISEHLSDDGTLDWQVPAGKWVILRVGMTPTGTKNSPAAPHGRGYEVDKMSRRAVAYHFEQYIGKVLQRMPEADRTAFKKVVADSYETGPENWTEGFAEEFEDTYGYNPLEWLPVMTGRLVGSADQSERFLWDLRRLVADKVARGYVGGLREQCDEHGLNLWLENYGHWGFPGEFLQYGGQSDMLGGEFWIQGPLGDIECRAAASAAHVYGKNRVYAEAFTSAGPMWRTHPWTFKKRGDWAYTEGINHFVLHVYIHQFQDRRLPGVNAWFGTEFNRNNTWFAECGAWIDYLRRCHYMLQQGYNVADVCYFIGEDVPKMTGQREPKLPAGYAYDFVNAEAIEMMTLRDGYFVLPSGARYRLMVLPPVETMRPEVLQKLETLVQAGGAILGDPPSRSPSMENYPDCDRLVRALAERMWQDCDGDQKTRVDYGGGQIFRGVGIKAALDQLRLAPAVAGLDPEGQLFVHRGDVGMDLFFISNQRDQGVLLSPVFRVQGRRPELWHPDRGSIELPACYRQDGDGVRVPLRLEARGSVFVVFRRPAEVEAVRTVKRDGQEIWSAQRDLEPKVAAWPAVWATVEQGAIRVESSGSGDVELELADGSHRLVKVDAIPDAMDIPGPWQVSFDPQRGGPEQVTFDHLLSWPDHPEEDIRYYSGTAVYHTTFEVSADWLDAGRRITLDLGDVQIMAKVRLNGRELISLWKPPFTAEVGDKLRVGQNQLEVEVVNSWANRIIGDEQYPSDCTWETVAVGQYLKQWPEWFVEKQPRPTPRQTLYTVKHMPMDMNLMRSGLIGPVRLTATADVRAE